MATSTTACERAGAVPVLVVTDVAARLVRRGLLAPRAVTAGGWRRTRVLVFRTGPVVCERPAGSLLPDVALHASTAPLR